MSGLLSAGTLAALLIVCAAPTPGAGNAEPAGRTGGDSPANCTGYTTGSDTHTACASAASAPLSSVRQGTAIACHNYTVGSDTHVECASAAAPRLGAPLEKKRGLVSPSVPALRCYTYRIGSSAYTDCR